MNFAAQLHIRPWEIGDLTSAQFYAAIAEFDRQANEKS